MTAQHDGIHPDEGSIHAWLDDALDAADVSRIAEHVSACEACTARVAEARGLIAGASRVVRLLDGEPVPLLATASAAPTTGTSRWRMFRVTPARAAIAATLIVAVGITLTRDKAAVESSATFSDTRATAVSPVASAPMADAAAPEQAAQSQARPDSVLASAVTRRIREETPQRTIGNAAGVAIPTAPPSVASDQAVSTDAARKVAVGRDSARLSEVVGTATASDRSRLMARGNVAPPSGAGCYRVESRDGGDSWLGIPLPAEIALVSVAAPAEERADGRGARSFAITPVGGGAAIGSWRRTAGDTVALELRSSFATTTGILTGSGTTLSGTLQASTSEGREASAPAAAPARADARMRQSAGAGAATSSSVRVGMRAIACPR